MHSKKLTIGLTEIYNSKYLGNRILKYNCFVPLSYGYLKSYIDKHLPNKVQFKIINSLEDIYKENIDLIGITTYTAFYNEIISFCKAVKNNYPDKTIFLGGHHITMLPDTLPQEVDFAVLGEGEETLREILDIWLQSEGNNFKEKMKLGVKWDKVSGLAYRDSNNDLKITSPRALLDINNIPFMDQSILKMGYKNYRSVFSSRGCPYTCPFCSMSQFWKCVRLFSADYTISELEYILTSYPLTEDITFEDDLFIVDKNRIKLLAELIQKKGFNKLTSFSCLVRANLIDEDMCILLKQMNVKFLMIGIESANDNILKLLKPGITANINQQALDILYKYNIKVGGFFIFGTPGETEDAFMDTYNFIINNLKNKKLFSVGITVLHPLPGTYFWNYALNKGYVSNNMDWSKLSNMGLLIFPNTFEKWRKEREGYSIYLNNDFIKESRFYDLLESLYNEIVKIKF